ncbi:MAG: di-trans,poly-cis-decaprenylcistransferase [Clostridiales bacterium]|nr:di-trans,poly-cis-decaprenylcistransferase [Clostridiales bacterium]
MKSDNSEKKIPRHIGIIMDGNRRWATKHLLPRVAGHAVGVKNIKPIVKAAIDYGVQSVTLYAFSSENKGRAKDEVESLIDLIRKHLLPLSKEVLALSARVNFFGDISYFPDDVQQIIDGIYKEGEGLTKSVNIALNYSGRAEIIRAARLAAEDGELSESSFERHLYTAGTPELDMIIRTGGEKRLSNFLLYQAAYSELFFTDTLWPDFDKAELIGLFDEYSHRTRRFGTS